MEMNTQMRGSLIIRVSRSEFVFIEDNANRVVRFMGVYSVYIERKLLT